MTRRTIGNPSAFTVEIEDVTLPATFTRLPDALAALWSSLRALPLGAQQYDAYQYFLTRPNAAEHVAGYIEQDGELALSFRMEDRVHAVWVRPVGPPPEARAPTG
ncbi:hypothetical protein [Kitasatospora sp. NBC_00315]|uniref:hypothetical protein n=1 Tax=Kitasatospora sp. NBC_00315 TaxID=2975963 RepID=UPI003253AF3F